MWKIYIKLLFWVSFLGPQGQRTKWARARGGGGGERGGGGGGGGGGGVEWMGSGGSDINFEVSTEVLRLGGSAESFSKIDVCLDVASSWAHSVALYIGMS